jgi:spoIIIJ-associated protein
MESTERTGRTVDEAVEAALKALGASRDQVDVAVLSEEKRGLLGIFGSSSAKVRVTVKTGEMFDGEPKESDSFSADEDLEEEPEEELYEEEEEAEEEEAEEEQALAPALEGELSELAERTVDVLEKIIALMGLDAETRVIGDDAEGVSVDIHSAQDLGLLIGKRGQTLSALQLLVAIMANRPLPLERRRRVILDAEGYRDRRDRALKAMARSAAQRAKRSGRPVRLDSLNPRERRVVHLALADDASVETRSEGEDPNRTIVVTVRRRGRPG